MKPKPSIYFRMRYLVLLSFLLCSTYTQLRGAEDYQRALRRAQYLLNTTVPNDEDFSQHSDQSGYRQAVRKFIDHPNFYQVVLRYHQRLFGVGLPTEYIDELLRSDIDNKENKFAQIICKNTDDSDQKLSCEWSSSTDKSKASSCPKAWQEAVSVFWYPGIVAWTCPSVIRSCGSDLSRCFIEFEDQDVAVNSELGTTEAFDSRFSVVKSLAIQPAGIATAVAVDNYPYTKILEPGITAVDGAIAHFYRQKHHFDLTKLNLSNEFLSLVESISLTDTRFHLINAGRSYDQGGILSTFGWLRRYEKNRTRANQLYERLLCRKFTAELPKIFPQDPGNLRETPGCEGCHATLDPLADFFKIWGEGGELYSGNQSTVSTTFGGQTGNYISDLADIVKNDNAFATCTVENVWKWLIGRPFHEQEAEVRSVLTNYFLTTDYSFKELVYAIATGPTFTDAHRHNSTLNLTLSQPPLGEPPGGNDLPDCNTTISYELDIQPNIGMCAGGNCHSQGSGRSPLTTEAEWAEVADEAVGLMTSGQMPIGQSGPPLIGPVFDFKEAVRCWAEQNR